MSWQKVSPVSLLGESILYHSLSNGPGFHRKIMANDPGNSLSLGKCIAHSKIVVPGERLHPAIESVKAHFK
jgi:hypothetical protein